MIFVMISRLRDLLYIRANCNQNHKLTLFCVNHAIVGYSTYWGKTKVVANLWFSRLNKHFSPWCGVKNWIAVRAMYKSWLYRRTSVCYFFYCVPQGIFFKNWIITLLIPKLLFLNAGVGIAGIISKAMFNTFWSHERRCALFRHLCVYFLKIEDFMRRHARILVIKV
jgi:hypothetical protein